MRQLRRLNRQELWAGADVTLTMNIKDTSGEAVDITGASVQWKLAKGRPRRRIKPWSGSPKLTKTATITDATSGAISVALTPADLDGLKGDYWQQFVVTDSSSNVTFVGGGEVFITAEMGS